MDKWVLIVVVIRGTVFGTGSPHETHDECMRIEIPKANARAIQMDRPTNFMSYCYQVRHVMKAWPDITWE